jgi:hypothetical protein
MNLRMKMMLARRGLMDQAGDGTGDAGDGANGGAGKSADELAAATAAAAKAKADADAKAGKPSDEEAKLLKEVMDKKTKLEKAITDNAALQAQLKQFEGIDPEAIRKMLADQKFAEDKQLEAKGDFDRLKARMAEEHAKEVKSLKDENDELKAQSAKANSMIGDLTVGTEFGNSKFISEELTLTPSKTRVIYGDHFEIVDGKVVGYDKPRGNAQRTALVDQYGNNVSFDDAMRKIIEADPEKDHMLKSKVKAGADSDSKKPKGGVKSQDSTQTSGLSRISAGLKGLNIN